MTSIELSRVGSFQLTQHLSLAPASVGHLPAICRVPRGRSVAARHCQSQSPAKRAHSTDSNARARPSNRDHVFEIDFPVRYPRRWPRGAQARARSQPILGELTRPSGSRDSVTRFERRSFVSLGSRAPTSVLAYAVGRPLATPNRRAAAAAAAARRLSLQSDN